MAGNGGLGGVGQVGAVRLGKKDGLDRLAMWVGVTGQVWTEDVGFIGAAGR